ncbi:MAG TPA: ABC transporter substrate-binding protein [Burkholderiales bacterium]|nr:ABC transporter substrate-binding protein [Burkholderiales bacterium]
MALAKHVQLAVVAALCAATTVAGPASAQTVRIGLINTYSGAMASNGDQIEKAINLFMKLGQCKLPPGVNLEIIKRDDTGINPETAKRLATELIVRDKVQMITGVVWTPNALSIAPVVTEAKVPFVIMNAGTAMITTTSPFIARTSFTLWQSSYPMGTWAAKRFKTAYVAVADFGPGHDAQEAFTKAFTAAGGKVVGSVRMPPPTTDFAPFLQRVKDAKPDALFVFVPAGKNATALIKGFGELGLAQAGIKLIGPGDIVTDEELPNMGDVPIGVMTMFHYSAAGDRPANKSFVAAYQKEYGPNAWPNFISVGAWDAMQAICDVVRAQNGKVDGEKTMLLLRGWKNANSPRGPIEIDPRTRDIVQNEYVRETRKVGGIMKNVELETIPSVKDPWKEITGKQ